MPYFVPAWLFSSIGTSTITLASVIVRKACSQFIPSATSPDGEQIARDVVRHTHPQCGVVVRRPLPLVRPGRRQLGVGVPAARDHRGVAELNPPVGVDHLVLRSRRLSHPSPLGRGA